MKKICFITRDGVVNNKAPEFEHVLSVDNFRLIPSTVNVLVVLKTLGFEFIILTNQPAVGRNYMSIGVLDEIHAYMRARLKHSGIEILDVFTCAHYNESCDCQMPREGLLRLACDKYSISISESLFISDSLQETRMAAQFGVGSWIYTESDGFLPSLSSSCKK